jgi:hypothetical protein
VTRAADRIGEPVPVATTTTTTTTTTTVGGASSSSAQQPNEQQQQQQRPSERPGEIDSSRSLPASSPQEVTPLAMDEQDSNAAPAWHRGVGQHASLMLLFSLVGCVALVTLVGVLCCYCRRRSRKDRYGHARLQSRLGCRFARLLVRVRRSAPLIQLPMPDSTLRSAFGQPSRSD